MVVAYALSPVDLIPDFIPVIRYLDDLVIIPAGVYLSLKMIPSEIQEEHRRKITAEKPFRPKWIVATAIILA